MPALLDAGFRAPVAGAFTTRAGGVSAAPWDSLDLALHVGDEPAHVHANRQLLRAAVGGGPLVFAGQVHGTGVATVDSAIMDSAIPDSAIPDSAIPDSASVDSACVDGAAAGTVPAVDALVTATPGLALVVLAADCLPVLLADPVAGVVAAAHAGRPGLAAGVLTATLAAMARLGACPEQTRAVLGPAVCGACYELPAALADEVGALVPGSRATTRRGTPSVDLAAGAAAVLRASGVGEVVRIGGCTLEQPALFFSYRRDGTTGRHAGVVRLLS